MKGLKELNIITPTEIQSQVIPLLLDRDTDLVGQAQTGTGKTAAYGLPMLQRIEPGKKVVQGLVLCPTRELGQQIAKQFFKFTKYSDKIFTEAVFGGKQIEWHINALKKPTHIVVSLWHYFLQRCCWPWLHIYCYFCRLYYVILHMYHQSDTLKRCCLLC